MDRPLLATGPDTSADPAGERTRYEYDAAGRLLRVTDPKGVQTAGVADDYTTVYAYDALDRIVTETQLEVAETTRTLRTHYCYDAAGDLSRVTMPRAGLDSVDCAAAVPPPFTSRLFYDGAHRLLREVDAAGNEETTEYDANDQAVATVDAAGARTSREYDELGRLVRLVEPYEGTRTLTTRYEYDRTGNLVREISPRAWDASADKLTFASFVTSYLYDELGRQTRVALPTAPGQTQAYVHYAYDSVGNLVWTSQPSESATAEGVPADSGSQLEYWDTGWIRTSKDANRPRLHFDYTAEGWQSERVPENDAGAFALDRKMLWSYYPDGALRETKDLAGQGASYTYDANGNQLRIAEASGLTSAGADPLAIDVLHDTLDRLVEVRQGRLGGGDVTITRYAYDAHGNVVEQLGNRVENGSTVVAAGRRETFEYDARDLPTVQVDFGLDAGQADDLRTTRTYWPDGLDRQRRLERIEAGAWKTDQVVDSTSYLNGLLRTQVTTNGAGEVLESHTLSYVGADGVYLDGNRASDVFRLKGPDTAAPCRDTTCTATYEYDALERLVRQNDGHGTTTVFTLDVAGNVVTEAATKAGVTTTSTSTYVANQLRASTEGTRSKKYFYTADGNVDCVTTGAGSDGDCALASELTPPATLLESYAYDYRNRLSTVRRFEAGAQTVGSSYRYDSLDRPVRQIDHWGTDPEVVTDLAYIGLTTDVGGERETEAGVPPTEKAYNYDAFGERTGLTASTPGAPTERFSYGHDTQGSVSLLVGQAGAARASYGYKAYGESDSALTAGDTNARNPLNSYRYTDKRLDPASGTLDMGARRFSPDAGRFLQLDQYHDALADLDLTTDALTGNRYALAGGNPISFVEVDGHFLGLPNPVKAAKNVGKGIVSVAKYCTGRGAGTCAMVAGGVALTATGVGAVAGGGMIAAGAATVATTATITSRGLGAYASARGAAQSAKRGDVVGAMASVATMGRGPAVSKGPLKAVNGNSHLSKKAQHQYVIVEVKANGRKDLHKTGISGGAIRKSDGKSVRAEKQVRALEKKNPGSRYESHIIDRAPNRLEIVKKEQALVDKVYDRRAQKLPGNTRPLPTPTKKK
jgi:RHS repeat-associated protein